MQGNIHNTTMPQQKGYLQAPLGHPGVAFYVLLCSIHPPCISHQLTSDS